MIANIIVGLLLLFMGRKLFWLSMGIMGFLVGVNYAAAFMPQASGLNLFILAIFLGMVGALVAVVFEWVAVMLVGFLAGGYFLINVFSILTAQIQDAWWLYFIGGIIGMFIMAIAFNWALIGISCAAGAMLIVEHLNVDESLRNLIFICSLVIGILVQCITFKPTEDKAKEVIP